MFCCLYITGFEAPEAGLSNTIGAVRWALPDESLQAHSSVPSQSSQTHRPKVRKKEITIIDVFT